MSTKIALRLRKLHDGSLLVGEFDSPEDARQWLRERPRFVQVVGVASSIDEALAAELRTCMRDLDDDERALAHALDEARLAALREQIAAEEARVQAAHAAAKAANVDADPNRPMVVAWDIDHGFANGDPDDPREPTERACKAVTAWVAERNEWVHGRTQHVVRALVTVWPGPIPGGDEDERCHPGGQFEVAPGLR